MYTHTQNVRFIIESQRLRIAHTLLIYLHL